MKKQRQVLPILCPRPITPLTPPGPTRRMASVSIDTPSKQHMTPTTCRGPSSSYLVGRRQDHINNTVITNLQHVQPTAFLFSLLDETHSLQWRYQYRVSSGTPPNRGSHLYHVGIVAEGKGSIKTNLLSLTVTHVNLPPRINSTQLTSTRPNPTQPALPLPLSDLTYLPQ